ncbi:MAG: NRDE family protein [Hyphomonadaceae bacterium]|nr:NRDE family protein [Hyphomonadaceae bacterium]
MCTLTIWREEHHLTVTMNRDDAQARRESPPEMRAGTPHAVIAPRDEQAGGSWIAGNEYGLISCLLNRYDPAPQGRSSRGEIVLRAMDAATARDAALAFSPAPGEYSPFTCLLLDRDHSVHMDWNGAQMTRQILDLQPLEMLTSSSWQEDEVRAKRRNLFSAILAGPQSIADKIAAFHCYSESGSEMWTPMMQRPLSHTKSITRVSVTANAVAMSYWLRESAVARSLAEPDVLVSLPQSRHAPSAATAATL